MLVDLLNIGNSKESDYLRLKLFNDNTSIKSKNNYI